MSYKEALSRIKEAKENNSNNLDLSSLGLKEIPTEITELQNLTELNISGNEISYTVPLSKLQNLTKLTIVDNQISNTEPLSKLQNLTELNISGNEISYTVPLSKLQNLTKLTIVDNQISNTEPLSKLQNLTKLNISRNHIRDAAPLSNLQNLTELNISRNQIRDAAPLSNLQNLTMLDISNNQISDITPLKNLIEKICIRSRIRLKGNPLVTPPLEIVEQGTQKVLDYFKSIEEQGTQKLNEAKLIIVGEPESGKTTLSKMLRDPTYMPSGTPTTLGVEVDSWKFEDPNEENERELVANIWDFGGQEIQYMTHQFFLTPNSLYILVTANDREESTNFPYWFKIIHLLGESQGKYSPVLVVKNRRYKDNQFKLEDYGKMYPEHHIEVVEVDFSKRDSHYASMEQKIKEMIASLPIVNEQRPARWADIQDKLYANKQEHISFNEFAQICKESNVNTEASQMLLSSYLHRVGSLLHFSEDTILRNFIILKPQWAIKALYALLSDEEIARDNGRFSKEKYDEIWSKYSVEERGKLFALLLKDNFEICYEIDKQNGIYLAPQFLPYAKATYDNLGDDYLYFRFQYKFMPYGIIERLIVRMSENIKDDLVWKKGLVLEKNGAVAEVIQEENRGGLKVIDIKVYGSLEQRKYLLHEIREEIKKIHERWFRNISFDEMVPCICSECIGADKKNYYELDIIKELIEVNEKIQCIIKGVKGVRYVDARELIEGIKIPNEEKNKTYEKKPTFVIPEPKPIQPPEVKKYPFYKEWWFISLIVALFAGVGTYLWVGKLLPSLGVAFAIFLITIFFDPKKRFFKVGLLLLGIGASTFLPIVSKLIGKYLDINLDPNPWLSGLMIIVAFGLFVLDYFENKNG